MFSKPGFATWLLLMVLALIVYFQFLTGIALALILAVVCRPLFQFILQRFSRPRFFDIHPGMARSLASIATQLIVCIFVVICVMVPLWVLSKQQATILSSVESAYTEASNWGHAQAQIIRDRWHLKEWGNLGNSSNADDSAVPAPENLDQSMQNKFQTLIANPTPLLPYALRSLGGAALLVGQVMFFFLAFHFLLLHGPAFWQDVLSACPHKWEPTLRTIGDRSRTVLMATCVVHGLTAISAFLLALPIFLIILGWKHFLLLAMVAGFFQFIPLLGSATLVSIMTVYFFAVGSIPQAWETLLLAFPLIVGLPDLVVRPYLAQRYGKVHSMTMLIGFITGFEAFGVLGFVLGPLFLDLIVQYTHQVLPTHHTHASTLAIKRPQL